MSGSLHSIKYRQFLQSLRLAREKSGVSQTELAARMKVTQAFVSKSERGERRLDLLEVFAWLKALDYSPTTYLDREYRKWEQGRPEKALKKTSKE